MKGIFTRIFIEAWLVKKKAKSQVNIQARNKELEGKSW